jgi:ribosomal-protein-alanine N-acetyltransferase
MTPREYFTEIATLRTKRLMLRKLTTDDAADLFDYARDPAMTRYTSWAPHQTIDDSRRFLAFVESRYRNGEPVGYGVVDAKTNRMIGTCGLASFSEQHERGEIAYAIAAAYWGKGYMTEAARAVVDDAFRVLPLNRLQSCCHVDNVGSRRVMEKLGMTYEGILRDYFKFQGRYDSVRFYSLLRGEWESQAAASRII